MISRSAAGSLVTLVVLSTVGCSSSDSGSTPSTNGSAVFNTAISTVQSKMKKFDDMLPNNEGASSIPGFMAGSSDRVHIKTAFGNAWATDYDLANPRCSGEDMGSAACTTPVTLKEWMGYQLDPEAVRENGSDINVFGRFNSAVRISCAFMNAIPVDATTGYPNNGSHTITLTESVVSTLVANCGFASDDVPVSASITATVSTPSDTTYYDRKIVLQLAAEMGGGDQAFYMRVNSSSVNIMTAESNSNGYSRTVVALNKTTDVLRVEYFSGGSTTEGGFNFYRLYYDGDNDIGRMFGYEGGATGSDGVRYTLSGKPNTGTEVALSLDYKGYGTGASYDKAYQACITMADGTIAVGNDDKLTCADSITGTGINEAALATLYNDVFANRADSGWYDNADETLTLDFDATTIFSASATY